MLNRWSSIIHKQETIIKITKSVSESRYNKISEIWWNFCTKQCTRIYWNKFPEEFQQEIMGIADGVNARGKKLHGREVNYKDILTMNQMYEFMSKLTNLQMGFHPFQILIHQLKKVEPSTSDISNEALINGFMNEEEPHHCNGFIAVGDATTDGQMVFSHSTIAHDSLWWWNHFIAMRFNVLLDVQPSNGNRVIMSSSPGLIWSDEDYYQNDNGIVLLETTNPQGTYDKLGLPLSIRARKAIQYGNSIDEVVYYLRHKNDGSMNAVWLIGDDKTGEISRFELGYSAYAIYRTFDGFYWSANNPFDTKVRMEKFKFDFTFIYNKLKWILEQNRQIAYYSINYVAARRDLKYEELGNKYYGQIDTDIVKEIMSTDPISSSITDIKVTDSTILSKNGIWLYYGNPVKTISYNDLKTKEKENIVVNPTGWVRIFGIFSNESYNLRNQKNEYGDLTEVKWSYNTEFNENEFQSQGTIENDILYSTTSDGNIYALSSNNGHFQWERYLGNNPTKPVIKDDYIFIGHSEGLTALNIDGTFRWKFDSSDVISSPIVIEDIVIFGNNIGEIFALSCENGRRKWSIDLDYETYISKSFNDNIYISSKDSCYAVDLDDQEIIWTKSVGGMITSEPFFKNGIVYFGAWDNKIYALNAKNGDFKWDFETGWGIDTVPTISNNILYVGALDNNLYALNAINGELEWFYSCKAGIHSSPVVYGKYIFFGCDDGRVYALNKESGKPVWYYAPELFIDKDVDNFLTTPIISDPVLHEGKLFTGANGKIIALDAQTIEQYVSEEVEEKQVLSGTKSFLIFSLLIVILATVAYLIISKKRIK
jgi:outer membrane protein assembly factor BamB